MSDAKPDERRSAHVGRLMKILIGISLIAIGGLFITLMARSYLRAKEMRDWPVVSCVILESSIEERQHDPYSPIEFSHRIAYGYEWEDKSYTGSLISLRGAKWSSKPHSIRASLEQYPVGSVRKCHINPDNPSFAVLEMDSLAPLYSIWFPALFAIGGCGILASSFKGTRKPPSPAK